MSRHEDAFRTLKAQASIPESGTVRERVTAFLDQLAHVAEESTYSACMPALIDAANGGWPDVRVPTLIVHGSKDDVVDPELSRAWARGKRHVRLVEVDDEHELSASVARIAEEAERFLAPFLNRA